MILKIGVTSGNRAAARDESLSLLLSAIVAPKTSDDDNIGAWVCKYVPPEHWHISAWHFNELLPNNTHENGLVNDGLKGLLITE